MLFKFKNRLVEQDTICVMAIANLTDDSFYAGSRLSVSGGEFDEQTFRKHIDKALSEGAGIIDLGACSTRPQSQPVSPETEWQRLQPALEIMKSEYPQTPLSVDTFRPQIAERVAEYGIDIVNDISGGGQDMYDTVAKAGLTYVLTHNAPYETDDKVVDYFARRIDMLQRAGVHDIWIDPGFGFGKTTDDNFRMLRLLPWLKTMTGHPILVGLSRKSMIYKTLDITPEEALNGTIVCNTIAAMLGADILRVHDVLPATQLSALINKTKN